MIIVESKDPAVGTRDCFARHGEELVRSRYGAEVANQSFEWPDTGVTRENFRETEVIVARVDGVVAGRAILDMAFHPIAELENLEVSPPFRGRGVGGAIVGHAVEVASRAGFLAIHVQTSRDNIRAQRLYAQHGFLPATRGDMLRVWRFLNLPVLSQFLHDHPMALLDSSRVSDREHALRWRDVVSEDQLEVIVSGGSCQSDGGGLGPAVCALRLHSGSFELAAELNADTSVRVGDAFHTRILLINNGADDLIGGFRIGLNRGLRIASSYQGGEQFSISPGAGIERSADVLVESDFAVETLDICAYRSVPITVDFLLGDNTFWLAAQVAVTKPMQH